MIALLPHSSLTLRSLGGRSTTQSQAGELVQGFIGNGQLVRVGHPGDACREIKLRPVQGIGGGDGGAEGTITISGGQIFAANLSGGYDIGPGGVLPSSGTITFSDSVVVFTYNDKVSNPTLLDPIEYISSPDLSGDSYRGIPLNEYTKLSKGVYLPGKHTPISAIPATGEDITNLYWFIGIGLAALCGIAVLLGNRKKMRIQ